MNNQKEKELTIDEWIWIIFIILSIMNILGDELEKKFYRERVIQKYFYFNRPYFLLYLYLFILSPVSSHSNQ